MRLKPTYLKINGTHDYKSISSKGDLKLSLERFTSVQQSLSQTHLKQATYVIFDLETTGGNPQKSSIIEIYAKKISQGKVVGEFYSLAKPKRKIPHLIQKMTGINNQMVDKSPSIEKIYPKISRFISDSILVSHNTISDIRHLRHLERACFERELPCFFLCTHLLGEKLLPLAPDKSLSGLASYLGKPIGSVHRAKEDTKLTEFLYAKLQTLLISRGVDTIRSAILFQGDMDSAKRLTHLIPEAQVKDLPTCPGVITLYSSDETSIAHLPAQNMRLKLEQVKNYDLMSKDMIRTIIRATHLSICKQSTFVEALFLATKKSISTQTLVPALEWWGRPSQFINIEHKDKSQYRVCINEVNQNTIKAFGPLYDLKKTKRELEMIAHQIGTSVSKRGFEIKKYQLQNILCRIQPEPKLSSLLVAEVSSIFDHSGFMNYFIKIGMMLKKHGYAQFNEPNLKDFINLTGLMAVRHLKDSPQITLILIIKGIPMHEAHAPKNWSHWLRETDGKNFLERCRYTLQENKNSDFTDFTSTELRKTFFWVKINLKRQFSWHSDIKKFYPKQL